GALGQQARVGVAGVELELGGAGGNVDHHPVPEAAAGGRVGIEAGDGEALGSLRHVGPAEMRRLVAAAAAKAVIRRQDVVHLEGLALLEAVAREREGHVSSRMCSALNGDGSGWPLLLQPSDVAAD